MIALLAALFPLGLGALILRAMQLRRCEAPLAYWAWAYLLGCLGVAAWVWLVVLLRMDAPAWQLSWLGIGGWLCWHARRAGEGPVAVAGPRPNPGVVWFLLLAAALILLLAASGMDRPCVEGDEGNIWSLKAKSLLVDHENFAAAQIYNLHPDYPQLNPLLQAWMYLWTNGEPFDPFRSRWPVQGCQLALFLALFAALLARVRGWVAAGLSLLVLLEPEFLNLCRVAYADGMVALGLVVALDAGLAWRATGDRRRLWLSAAGMAFALWAKNESLMYAAAFVAVWSCARQKRVLADWRALGLPLLLPVLVVVGSMAWNRWFALRSDLWGANPTGKSMFSLMREQASERVPAMLAEFADVCVGWSRGHWVFAVLLLACWFWRSWHTRGLLVPVVALLLSLVGLHAVYVGSFLPLRFHLDTSYARVLFQLLPAAVLLFGAWLGQPAADNRGPR